MAYEISNNRAIITGYEGPAGNKAKGANYGRNAASNYLGYINDFKADTTALNPDIFTKTGSTGEMAAEIKRLEAEKTPPVNFTLEYSPKKNPVFAFFNKLFTGTKINKQALLGFSYEAMNKMQYQDPETLENTHKEATKTAKKLEAIPIEKADLPFKDKAFSDINANLTSKAFDVNNDGKIDISEEAVSTVIADVLSKDESLNPMSITVSDVKKADGSYTNSGENRMMAFLREENLETASKIAKDIHSKLGLDKAQEKFLKTL